MRFHPPLIFALLALCGSVASAYVPGKSPSGADRHWDSGTIAVRLTGPTVVDGHDVHDAARNAMASWNAIAYARIALSVSGAVDRREPSIGNGRNEIGWVESSDSPYFIPGVPCTVAVIYDTVTGVMAEADTTCNAMAYQWPDDLFGNYTQDNVADAETAALAAFGYGLGLDASLEYGDAMYPADGPGFVLRALSADEIAFGRHRYGSGASSRGSLGGTVRFRDGSPIPYAYVVAFGAGYDRYGAVADANGAYTIFEMAAGAYTVLARPLTTDPYVLSSVPYRANAIRNLDFMPEYHAGGARVEVRDGSTTPRVDITVNRSGSQPDAYEPNDTVATATPLTVGLSKLAAAHGPSDNDWYGFQTAANTCYVVATGFHGASIAPTRTTDAFWSRTRLSIYDDGRLVGSNESKDEFQLDPGNWLTYCETGSGRRLDVEVEQREGGGGAGFFYAVFASAVPNGSTLAPSVNGLYPDSGWSNRNRFVWIDGAGFMPGSKVDIRLPDATWVAASEVIATRCDATYRCGALKALLPPGPPGLADVKVTNPNGASAVKTAAFTYLAGSSGPIDDKTRQAFGVRYGEGKAVCVGDYDGDGSDDILKTRNGFLPYQLFKNTGGGFTDVAASSGLHRYSSVFGSSCSFVDVDDDGDLDAYITNVAYVLAAGSANELYINQSAGGGEPTFVLATPPGLGGAPTRYKSDAAWADFNNDGRLDVVLVYDTYAGSAPYQEAVQYLRQGGGGSFTDTTASSGLGGYFASITSVKAADFNNDGCEDLVFFTHAGLANRLYKGNCHGVFTDVTSSSHIAEGAPWCASVAVADFNDDARTDILCGTYNAGFGAVRPRLWLNNGSASFTDRALESGLHAVARNMDVVLAFDEDNDGRTDIFVGASENGWLDDRKDALLRNTGGNPPVFADVTDDANMYPTTHDGTGFCGPGVDEFYCDRDASAGGVLDWHNDGALDVFVTGGDPDFLQRGADFLWDNRRNALPDGTVSPANDWIDVALKGANTSDSRVLSNRSGLGARVTVIPRFNLAAGAVPTETQCLQNPLPAGVNGTTKEVLAGNQSQSSTVLHFGLGNSMPFGQKRVDCVKVAWPSGLERAYTGLTANTRVVLAEDVGRLKVISVLPNTGPNNRSDPTTVTGLRFDRDVTEVPQVFFGAVPARSVTFVSDHELTVLPPLWQPPGTVDVTVVNTDGARDTLLAGYTYTGSNQKVRFKDPVPDIITLDGVVPNNPNFVGARGIERTGVIADGVTELILEADVGGPGRVRFVLDDDDVATNAPPAAASVGTVTALAAGVPQTTVTVTITLLTDGRHVGHAVYKAPQEFIRTAADNPLASRSIRVRPTFIDAANVEYPMPVRSLELHRVPVLYVHGMWGGPSSFSWPILSDPRWITHRADYSETNDVAFAQNAGVPPRAVAELRKKINDLGIAGTRVFVFAHSMGAVLFKIYMAGAGATYLRADNFFAGDVYALVPVDAPFHGAHLASFASFVSSLRTIGAAFVAGMKLRGMSVDNGCMRSLDPGSSDMRDIPPAYGTFHGFAGWGGREMRALGVGLVESSRLESLKSVLRMFNYSFENYLLRCGSGDDFVVCTDSQQGGLAGGHVDDFHFVDLSQRAVHFDSISKEAAPSAAAERLLNTPSTNSSVWGQVLPAMPVAPLAGLRELKEHAGETAPIRTAGSDGIALALAKRGDDVALTFTGPATRLVKSFAPTLASGACVAVSGGGFTDARALTVPASLYYEAGTSALCAAGGPLAIAAASPAAGSAMGGYPITLLGSGFDAGTKVRIGEFYASDVVVLDSATITFRMMPGAPGATTITVIDGVGRAASKEFTLTDPGSIPGRVDIVAPADGAVVAAGSTMTISAVGSGGFTIDKALVSSAAFTADDDRDAGDGFATDVAVPSDALGPLTIGLVAKDVASNFKSAAPVTISVVLPGNVNLVRIEADGATLLYATPTRQLRVFGIYSDGIRREITRAPGILYEMDTQDPRKPNYPYNGAGVAAVDAAGVVTAKTRGRAVCHIAYAGRTIDVVVEVAEIRPRLTLGKPGFISWPYQGPGITYDVVRGKLSALRGTGGNFADPSVGTTCIKDNFANVTAADAANPPAGDGFFYLMRESRTFSYEESPAWATPSQIGRRTAEVGAAPYACP